MHSVMPSMLAKATEPSKLFVKDYGIDVEKRVQQVITDFKQKSKAKKSVDSGSSDSDSDAVNVAGHLHHKDQAKSKNSKQMNRLQNAKSAGQIKRNHRVKRMKVGSAIADCFSLHEIE